MFGIKALKQRVKELEDKVEILMQDKRCEKGSHCWKVGRNKDRKPYIACAHCYKQPEQEIKS